jgi:hypothetical protein
VDTALDAVLTEEHRRCFLENGFIRLTNAVPPEAIGPAVEALRAASPEGQVVVDDGTLGALVDACMPVLDQAVAEILGPDQPFARAGWHYIPRRHQANRQPARVTAHLDAAYPTLTPDNWVLRAFVFLARVPADGGAFLYAPGSPDRVRRLLHSENSDALPVAANRAAIGAGHASGLVPFVARAGDVIIYPHLMVHSASKNTGDPTGHRDVISMAYSTPGRVYPGTESLMTQSMRPARLAAAKPLVAPAPEWGEPLDGRLAGGDLPGLVAQAALRMAGAVHLFTVTADDRRTVRHSASANLTSWREVERLPFDCDVLTVHVDRRDELRLVVGVADGSIRVLVPGRPRGWRLAATTEDARAAHDMYTHPGHGSAAACGDTRFFARAEKVHWASGTRQEPFGGHTTSGVALECPGQIEDFVVAPVGPSHFAAVVDVVGSDAPLVTRSATADRFADPPAPMPLDVPVDRVSCVRVYERGRGFWLVTYLGAGRLYWGAVDWEEDGVLRQLRDGDALRSAMTTVGLL